ncbi:MAG: trifunctional transcriptional regulator/proline dehydrogenase/L-glutamate gamma-semialdehyde dehydrogenase [Betaproteobacteria bacterium]
MNACINATPATENPSTSAPGTRFCHGGPLGPRAALREAVTQAARLPEAQAMAPLLSLAQASPDRVERTDALARELVQGLRGGSTPVGRAGRVQGLMQAYSLSSEEGVALMCMAEALLRIPDHATREALIRDKIGRGDWQHHVGLGGSLFVNAATWGLMLTGKLLAPPKDGDLRGALTRLVIKGSETLIRQAVELAMQMLGEQFVAGETIEEALIRACEGQAQGFSYSYDMLGEAALTQDNAQRYWAAYEQAIHAIGRASAGRGVIDRPGISIKLSALHPRYTRAQHARVMNELLPRVLSLVELARHYDIGLNIDAEESDRLELSLDLLEALCTAPSLAGWNGIGFVVQAYGKRCPAVIDFLVDLGRRTEHRLMVRLVKGAYWDSEIKRAQVDGQIDYPVYTRKHHTDVAYLACARKLLAAPDAVYPQFASHNARTVAAIVHMGEALRGPFQSEHYEFQCLYGMGEPLYRQLVGASGLDRPCRIYAPVGTHETLLAYLVRRLLENGANSSFVNQLADPSVSLDELVCDPVQRAWAEAAVDGSPPGQPHPLIPLPGALYGSARGNSCGLDLADESTLGGLVRDLAAHAQTPLSVKPMVAVPCPMLPGAPEYPLRNPADARDVLGSVGHAMPHEVEAALHAAQALAVDWAATPPLQRAALLEQAADLMHAESTAGLSLLVREAGKTWAHAVAEWREAVDFLRYYAAQIRRDPAQTEHRPLGPVVCISPWNFPLAIFIGQAAAALAAGNPVLAKPAEQTPAVAAWAVSLLWRAGVPHAALQLLPGGGREVGQALVDDPRVQGVMFTGSTETAKLLQRALASRLNAYGQPVPLIAETGGQNAMVVDSSALLEQVVQDAVASAFEAAGQRCSALRVLCVQEDVADRLLLMLKGAMEEISVGDPAQLQTDMGPVIDEPAYRAIEDHVHKMKEADRMVHRGANASWYPAAKGFYVPPTLIEIERLDELRAEVFGPVLHVLRWRRDQLHQLLQQINATGYALTLGVHSRIDAFIEQVLRDTRCGNTYVNRNMVGAVVGVQPFGGDGLSGTGPKAGGPLYLLRLFARCPVDAAKRAVQAAGGAPPQTCTRRPLNALYEWAVATGRVRVAHACLQMANSHAAGMEALLPGPTGERNLYQVGPRHHVWCRVGNHAGAEDDLLVQIAAVLAVGGQVVLDKTAGALWEHLPQAVRALTAAPSGDFPAGVDAALIHDGPAGIVAFARQLADREGPIVSLTALPPGCTEVPLERLVVERSVSLNAAASGGNPGLMTMGG